MAERTDALAAVLQPVLTGLGLSLYDLELVGRGGARTLRVLVDRPDGAPLDLAAITAATNAISPLLDTDLGAARSLHGSYTLEVSSPGLERPLRTPAHFRGALGGVISIKTAPTAGGGAPRRVRGVVVDVDDDQVELEVDGARETFAYADVTQARTVFEWGTKPRAAKSKKQAKKQTKKMKMHQKMHQKMQRVP